MKRAVDSEFNLEDLIEDYTILNKGNSVVFRIKPDRKYELICLNFLGNEKLLRIDWRDSVISCTAFYSDDKNFCWSWGSSTTLCDRKYFEQGALIQKVAEKVTGLSYERYARRR